MIRVQHNPSTSDGFRAPPFDSVQRDLGEIEFDLDLAHDGVFQHTGFLQSDKLAPLRQEHVHREQSLRREVASMRACLVAQ